jgi:hypothetical protein
MMIMRIHETNRAKFILGIALLVAIVSPAQRLLSQSVVYPGVQSAPATDGCSGIWSNLVAPVVPASVPGKAAYVPSAPNYISFVLAETAKNDIGLNQTDVTLIITPPTGWIFRSDPSLPSYLYIDNSGDINVPTNALVVSDNAITLTFSSNVNGNKLDWLYFCNIQVRPTTGLITPPGPVRYAYRTGGNAVINGIASNSTIFASLTLTPGSFAFGGYLGFTTQPSSSDGTVCGTVQTVLKSLDCAGNPTTIGLPVSLPVVISLLPSALLTTIPQTVDIGSSGGNGSVSISGVIRNAGTYQVQATALARTVASDPFLLSACPPSVLVWTQQPIGAEMWNPLVQQPELQLQDPYGNPSYASGTVTLALDYSQTNPYDPASMLTGTLTAPILPSAMVSFSDIGVISQAVEFFRLTPTTSVAGVSTTQSNLFTFSSPLPVELISFSAGFRDSHVMLEWSTATESNNYGFVVERRADADGLWMDRGFVAGAGTSNAPRKYAFSDLPGDEASTWSYRLRQIDRDGKWSHSSIVTVETDGRVSPENLRMLPSVLSGSGQISVHLSDAATVTVSIYNLTGLRIAEIASNLALGSGSHHIPFTASKLLPGVYFVRLSTGTKNMTAKFVVQ